MPRIPELTGASVESAALPLPRRSGGSASAAAQAGEAVGEGLRTTAQALAKHYSVRAASANSTRVTEELTTIESVLQQARYKGDPDNPDDPPFATDPRLDADQRLLGKYRSAIAAARQRLSNDEQRQMFEQSIVPRALTIELDIAQEMAGRGERRKAEALQGYYGELGEAAENASQPDQLLALLALWSERFRSDKLWPLQPPENREALQQQLREALSGLVDRALRGLSRADPNSPVDRSAELLALYDAPIGAPDDFGGAKTIGQLLTGGDAAAWNEPIASTRTWQAAERLVDQILPFGSVPPSDIEHRLWTLLALAPPALRAAVERSAHERLKLANAALAGQVSAAYQDCYSWVLAHPGRTPNQCPSWSALVAGQAVNHQEWLRQLAAGEHETRQRDDQDYLERTIAPLLEHPEELAKKSEDWIASQPRLSSSTRAALRHAWREAVNYQTAVTPLAPAARRDTFRLIDDVLRAPITEAKVGGQLSDANRKRFERVRQALWKWAQQLHETPIANGGTGGGQRPLTPREVEDAYGRFALQTILYEKKTELIVALPPEELRKRIYETRLSVAPEQFEQTLADWSRVSGVPAAKYVKTIDAWLRTNGVPVTDRNRQRALAMHLAAAEPADELSRMLRDLDPRVSAQGVAPPRLPPPESQEQLSLDDVEAADEEEPDEEEPDEEEPDERSH